MTSESSASPEPAETSPPVETPGSSGAPESVTGETEPGDNEAVETGDSASVETGDSAAVDRGATADMDDSAAVEAGGSPAVEVPGSGAVEGPDGSGRRVMDADDYLAELGDLYTRLAESTGDFAANLTATWWRALPVDQPRGFDLGSVAAVLAGRLTRLQSGGDPLEQLLLGSIAYMTGAHDQARAEVAEIEELRRELERERRNRAVGGPDAEPESGDPEIDPPDAEPR